MSINSRTTQRSSGRPSHGLTLLSHNGDSIRAAGAGRIDRSSRGRAPIIRAVQSEANMLDEIAALFAVAFRRSLLRKNLSNCLAPCAPVEPSLGHAVNSRQKDEAA